MLLLEVRPHAAWAPASVFGVAVFILGLLPSTARAFTPQVAVRSEAHAAAVLINRQVALRLEGPAQLTRAQAVSARLLRLSTPQRLVIVPLGRRRLAIETAGGQMILIVTPADARAQASGLWPLARRWSSSIATLLNMPAFTFSPDHLPLIVPTGQARQLVVGGAAPASAVSFKDSARGVAWSRFDPSTRKLTVQGLAAGSCSVVVTAVDAHGEVAQKIVQVKVEDPAARIAQDGDGRVTGSPAAPRALVLQAVYNALYRMVQAPQGAHLEILQSPRILRDLPQGASVTVGVPLRATGPDRIPVEARPQVTIENDSALPPLTAADLFYSNDPEEIKHPQTLFRAVLPSLSRPARLVYHHINESGRALLLTIDVVNQGDEPATLHLLQGRAGPTGDPVEAGYRAGQQFLEGLQGNQGLVLGLPAGDRLTLMAERLPPGQTLSGTLQLAQVGTRASNLVVRVSAEPATYPLDPLRCLVRPAYGHGGAYAVCKTEGEPDRPGKVSAQVYSFPNVLVNGAYHVGGPWLSLNLGTGQAIVQQGSSNVLKGDYGVLYVYTLTLSNPTPRARQLVIDFEPQAGLAAGVFLIDNTRWVRVSQTDAPQDRPIDRLWLSPGQTTTLQIKTMPLSGSACPVALVAHDL